MSSSSAAARALPPTSSALAEARARVLQIDRNRTAMEAEMAMQIEVLGSVGMHEPLVDGAC